jgi:hypothetical protein
MFVISMAPLFSSNNLQCIKGVDILAMILRRAASFISVNIGKISLVAVERAINAASVVERAISDWSFDTHTIGQLAKVITYPVLDLEVTRSSAADCCFQSPACDISTKHSKLFALDGFSLTPISLVPAKYCAM